jgi:hypothetical protein
MGRRNGADQSSTPRFVVEASDRGITEITVRFPQGERDEAFDLVQRTLPGLRALDRLARVDGDSGEVRRPR